MVQGQLLIDTFPLKITRKERVMSEDVHGKPTPVLRIGGQFQRAGHPNANGRIYPYEVLSDAVSRLQEDIKGRKVMGEYDHPPDAKLHLDRVSHLITKLWMEGDIVMGECEVLEKTMYGAQLKALLESRVSVGISSRGVGDMETTIHENEEYFQVLPGYSFVTFDMVAEPSVRGSFMSMVNEPQVAESRIKTTQKRQVVAEKKLSSVIETVEDKKRLVVVEARKLLRSMVK